MNEINFKQNTEESLRKLAAQRHLYSKAKNLYCLQICLATIVVVVISLINLKYNIQNYIAIYCVLITVFDIGYLNDKIKSYKLKAASIQEMFDCYVLDIKWNSLINKVSENSIYRHSEDYFKKGGSKEKLKDWYSVEISKVDSLRGKLICQYTNCSYDKTIRSQFYKLSKILSFILIGVIVLLTSYKDYDFSTLFVTVLLPILPLIMLMINKAKENKESTETSNKIANTTSDITLLSSITENSIGAKSRELQNLIYRNRIDSPLIFDWFYSYKRDSLENEMNYSVTQLVDECNKTT